MALGAIPFPISGDLSVGGGGGCGGMLARLFGTGLKLGGERQGMKC